MTTTTFPSGTGIVTSYMYDDADRLTDIEHVKNGSTTIASVTYTLDDVGNRTQRIDQQGTHTYAYDDLYRLTSVTYPGPSTTTYAFDAFGNREEMTNPAGTTTYTYDDADRITEVQPPSPATAITYDWDDNGNLLERGSDEFVWDYEDRMVEATVNSVTTTFAYRGDGLRNSRTVGMTTTTFTWDINAGLPVVLDDGNQYVYGAGPSSMKPGGNCVGFNYLADGLGSTMAIVDSSGDVENGYTYDVYGEPTVTGSLGNEFDFAGQQTDPSTGLQYLRARYYDPVSGTFMSRDPLARFENWRHESFAYTNNPTTWDDPAGLCSYAQCPWLWRRISETVLQSDKISVEDLNAGWLTPLVKRISGKLGAGVCVKVLSCEYRVTQVTRVNVRTGERVTFVKRHFFLNLAVGVGAGVFGVGVCLTNVPGVTDDLLPLDWELPGPPPITVQGNGSW